MFGYSHISDSAKITYQVIDSFDWQDGQGLRKGYAYPSIPTLATIRGVADRTIQRHIEELVVAGLLTKEERIGQTSILYIEPRLETAPPGPPLWLSRTGLTLTNGSWPGLSFG